ncbi:bacterial extracellular solute-binding s, 5 Middle family protein [Yersinia rochesterensis]|uniref:Bacterial extracellular solute-binding s, 5 Middle family protein n=1 Tax=Yersinia rochesterensis TaxID=1604335 RepID=A0A386HG46_9GAMM|nr:SgrR family transcriptional regulator [Yersinia rochesterensis]AJI88909.1 HTH-type transcriptional regulator sgrR [Yersinia frederiksenii Y225]CNG77002.1 ABC transporter substrate-binding protein [Yersinia kristensenii]AIN19425.1 bacterial extracellular solute-binding s, 5 Middle family protein [Yersinia rochesterensis]AJJ36663.1 bacterial extracellular solute-binding s, 5 Middle family protein [Yersinia rochesterensis]AYD44374.1 SgrR family transcriptional regulator [Yersinia rochesterensi
MTSRRLEQQYLRLLHQVGVQPVEITLQELADKLSCTKRHMRTLLVQMQQAGWLIWQAEAGRGRRSHLQLLRNTHQLLMEKAEQLLDSGDFNEAIALLGEDKQLITPLLRAKLGYRIRDDYQALRIPYYRTMSNLYPGTPLRRSELHLVRQIFNGLTRIKEEDGEVTTDLAHKWRMLDPLHWRFYLRPAVQFHDGRELSSRDVVSSLTRSATLPLFSHIQKVSQHGPLSVVIELNQPDSRLPQLLAHHSALILPENHATQPDFASHPVGTGPYRVAENDDWHLQMKSFDHYFGFRGLLDEVEVLIFPDLARPPSGTPTVLSEQLSMANIQSATWLSSSISDIDYVSGSAASLTGKPSDSTQEMFLERGGYFLLCDSRSPHWHSIKQRRWLRKTLNPYHLIQPLIAPIRPFWVPATSVLPTWFHGIDSGEECAPFPIDHAVESEDMPVLTLAYHAQHPEYAMLVTEMTHILAAQGIKLAVIELDYITWAKGEAHVDLWLGTVNFAVPEEWNVGAWLLGSPLLRQCMTGGDGAQLQTSLHNWRNQSLGSEQLIREVIGSGWLQPLFHHWMRLKAPEQAQGAHLNNLGWFDFQTTWLEPE